MSRVDRGPSSTRERILRAGIHLFQSGGYHGTGLVEILEHAKAPKGSFYHHFPGGKEELAAVALAWLQGEITTLLDAQAQEGHGADSMVLSLARYITSGLRNPERARGLLFTILAQEAGDSILIQTALKDYLNTIRSRLAGVWTNDKPRADGAMLADQALALLQGGAVLARVEQRPEILQQIIESWLKSRT